MSGPDSSPVRPHPGRLLVEETDPQIRLAAHLELGRRALGRRDLEIAETHFRQACDLDPTDERPRAELRGMGRNERRGFFKGWFK